MANAVPSAKTSNRQWWVLAVMAFCMFVTVMDNTILTAALKSIQSQLSATNAQLQWSTDAYTLTFAALLFSAGVLGDRYGHRRILTAGLVLFAVVSAVAAFATDTTQLIVWRAVMGVVAAVVPGCSMAVVTHVFPVAQRAKAVALWSVSAGVGIAAGPVIGGALLDKFWWGSALLINTPLAGIAAVCIVLLVPDTRDPAPGRLDLLGVALSIAGIGFLVYGIISGGNATSWTGIGVLGPIAAGIALLGVLIWHESRTANPALDLSLFRRREFSAGSAALSTIYFALLGASYVAVFYVQVLRGFSPLQFGLLTLPVALGAIVAGARSAAFVERSSAASVIAVGAGAMALSFLGYAVINANTPIAVFIVLQGVTGIGFGLTLSPAMAVALSVVPQNRAGAASAVVNALRNTGSALGVAAIGSVLGSVYRARLGDRIDVLPAALRAEAGNSLGSTLFTTQRASRGLGPHTPVLIDSARSAFVAAMHWAFVVSAAFAAVAVLVSVCWIPGPRKNARATPAAHPVDRPAQPVD
jgi:EmrB/QacA subfamily drug resistance transporter